MTFPPDVIERGRAYLKSKAAELSIEEIIAKVEAALEKAHAAAEAVPGHRFVVSPAEGEWSGEECLRHLVEWDVRNAQQILYVALSGELPPEADVQLPADRETLLARHREAIDSLFAHVREAAPDAFLGIEWEHPFFGALNWREWLLFLELHNRDHGGQLQAMAGG